MKSKTYIVYDNDEGESFTRQSDTYGHTGEYDVSRPTKKELDDWLTRHGFRVTGYETEWERGEE